MEKLYYTPREAAAILGISDDAVLDLVNAGTMPAFRVSARITRIPIDAFDLWRSGYTPRRRTVAVAEVDQHVPMGDGEVLPVPELMGGR